MQGSGRFFTILKMTARRIKIIEIHDKLCYSVNRDFVRDTPKAFLTQEERKFKDMDIRKELMGDRLDMAVIGRLDTTTAPELDAALKEALPGVKELVLDFSALDYISSAGLRVLLSTQKRMSKQGSMTLTGVNEGVMEVFEITGFSGILTIE